MLKNKGLDNVSYDIVLVIYLLKQYVENSNHSSYHYFSFMFCQLFTKFCDGMTVGVCFLLLITTD